MSITPRSGVPCNQATGADCTITPSDFNGECFNGFYSNRCKTIVDPANLNTVISELVNAVKCAGLKWDCDSYDNLCAAIQRIANDTIFSCLDGAFPDAGTICGAIRQVVLINDGDCVRFATYSQSGAGSASAGYSSVATHIPPNTGGLTIPESFPDPTLFYDLGDYINDGGVDINPGVTGGGRRPAPGLNEAKIVNSRYARVEFTNPCPRTYEQVINRTHMRAADADTGYRLQATDIYRVRVDGSAWEYPYAPGPGNLSTFGAQNALSQTFSNRGRFFLPAGNIEMEWFYIAPNDGNHVQWGANTFLPGFAPFTPNVNVFPAL